MSVTVMNIGYSHVSIGYTHVNIGYSHVNQCADVNNYYSNDCFQNIRDRDMKD